MKKENEIEVSDELIARYLSGEATPEEAMALHDWVKDAQSSAYFEKMAAAWEVAHPGKKFKSVDKAGAWAKLALQAEPKRINKEKTKLFGLKKSTLSIAASVLVVLVSGLLIYTKVARDVPVMLMVTTSDEFKNITFSDSSTARLNYHTSLSFPDKFSTRKREIHLGIGEAFFDVAYDKNNPFTIHTKLADISVMGTSFNVITDEDQVEVSVKSGVVAVHTDWDSITLDPGFSAIVKSGKAPIMRHELSDINIWAYATGRFEFKDTSLSKIILSLKKTFPSYSFSLRNHDIGNCKVTATFQDESIDKIVDLIVETLNLSSTRNGTAVILEGKGCP